MRTYRAILGGAVVLLIVVLSVGVWGVNQATGVPAGVFTFAAGAGATIPSTRTSQANGGAIAAAAATGRWVWFFPQDGPTTATVINLLNLGTGTVNVVLNAYLTDGTSKSFTLSMPANDVETVCTDKVTGVTGWTWCDFGTTVFLAELWLPSGVVADGCIVWNGTGDTYDPGASVPRLPLNFLEKPAL